MKKDVKFLKDLEKNLVDLKDTEKEKILAKYKNIIDEERSKNKKITSVIKELGDPKEIASNEMELIKKSKVSIFTKISDKFKSINEKIKEKRNNRKKEKEINKKLKENNFEKVKNKKSIKDYFNKIKNAITKDLTSKKERKVTDSPKEIKEEIEEEFEEEISEVSEIVTENHIFESKKDRRKRIILRSIGVVFTIILLFIWLWVTVIFIASLVAYLDGVKIIGLIFALFGLDLLLLWIVVMVNRALFKKKMSLRVNLIFTIICLIVIALGIVFTIKKITSIEKVQDVSIKYSMTNKLLNYTLPSDTNQKFAITFNSNYNTQYTIVNDDTLKNRVKIEIKYYECYYDYYVKETSNSAYISLKLDNRDRLSVYIDDFKEGKVFDNDELSRYTVKISINSKDMNRIIVQN